MSAAFALAPPPLRTGLPQTLPSRQRRLHTVHRRARITATIKPQSDPSATPLTPSQPSAPAANGAPAEPSVPESDERDIQKDVLATVSWIGVAAVVGGLIGMRSSTHGLEFVTAYIVEYSLSVDNLFVFLLIFEYFRVPRGSQSRVLTYGILGAMAMRGIMIVAGEALTHRFKAVTVGFAALLLFSAARLLFEEEEEEDLENNAIVKFSRGLLPFSDHYEREKFFTMRNGARLATPLMLVLLCIEFSDVVFALDSVPAVLGISEDTTVIYLSNILAIMGLRNLYFVLSDAIGDLRFLRQSLAIVLGFVGGKMLAGVAGYEVGVVQSLSIVVGTLAAGVGLSLAFPEGQEKEA